MSYKPSCTTYLCAGTGMDYNNSIWWHRFAYPSTTATRDRSWWNTCFQFFKAHSIAHGYWYNTHTTKPYFDVGRNTLYSESREPNEVGEHGLGNNSLQADLENPAIDLIEVLRGVDYICFSNDVEGEGFTADVQYAFVTRLEKINFNMVRVHFVIDAIMTYQKYFYLGKSCVKRDMEFQEWKEDETVNEVNIFPEPVTVKDQDYVLQHLTNTGENTAALTITQFGKYDKLLVTSDVNLVSDKIIPNQAYQAIPSFEPSMSSKVAGVELGLGVYYIPNRANNEAFKKLGSFNAMEHILNSYVVPNGIMADWTNVGEAGQNYFLQDTDLFIKAGLKKDVLHTVKFPDSFSDLQNTAPEQVGWKPNNVKCLTAPYTYYSISDKQGGSLEIMPQELLSSAAGKLITELNFMLNMTIAPNVASNIYIRNIRTQQGSEWIPFTTLWQMPTYVMTPNNSGYNMQMVQAIAQRNQARTEVLIGVGGSLAAGAIGGVLGIATQGLGSLVENTAKQGAWSGYQAASAFEGAGISRLVKANQLETQAEVNAMYGLPKVVGGLATGMTKYQLENAGYEFFFCHLKTEYMKYVDYLFSIMGYNQNGVFRFPHINIRKNWCYVQLDTVNMMPMAANNYDRGGVPFEMRDQIVSRLQSGVTFWNVRHALMGDGDSGQSDVQSWDDSRIQSVVGCKFVKNYGNAPDATVVKDNRSLVGGYASDYSDEHEVE